LTCPQAEIVVLVFFNMILLALFSNLVKKIPRRTRREDLVKANCTRLEIILVVNLFLYRPDRRHDIYNQCVDKSDGSGHEQLPPLSNL